VHVYFGEVVEHEMMMSGFGEIVSREWQRTEVIRPDVALDEFVIMPNHLHAILWIARKVDTNNHPVDAHSRAPSRDPQPRLMRPPRSLGAIIAGFKAATTKQINELRGTPGVRVWQPNYYDRVIRNDYELDRIRAYIGQNPERWAEDSLHPTG
jgi:REP element-mobilizing transposase RayT